MLWVPSLLEVSTGPGGPPLQHRPTGPPSSPTACNVRRGEWPSKTRPPYAVDYYVFSRTGPAYIIGDFQVQEIAALFLFVPTR